MKMFWGTTVRVGVNALVFVVSLSILPTLVMGLSLQLEADVPVHQGKDSHGHPRKLSLGLCLEVATVLLS